jgi:hypothetical protein
VPFRNSRRLNFGRVMSRSGTVCVDMSPPHEFFHAVTRKPG